MKGDDGCGDGWWVGGCGSSCVGCVVFARDWKFMFSNF